MIVLDRRLLDVRVDGRSSLEVDRLVQIRSVVEPTVVDVGAWPAPTSGRLLEITKENVVNMTGFIAIQITHDKKGAGEFPRPSQAAATAIVVLNNSWTD